MDLFRQKTAKWLKGNWVLLAISVSGLALRLLGLINIRLAGDNIIFWSAARSIVETGKLPLLGPSASVNSSFHLGPAYYYFLSIPYFLSHGNFNFAIIFSSVINFFSIPLLYLVSRSWLSKSDSLKITALFAFSSYMISLQSFPWNPYFLPLLIILSLYFIVKINEKKYFFFPLLCIVWGIAIQLHATALFLLPIFLYLLPLRKISIRQYLLGLTAFLIANSPWLYVNLTTDLSQLKEAFLIFSPGQTGNCSFSYWLLNHGHGERCFAYLRNTLFAFRFVAMSLFNSENLILVFSTMIITILYFVKARMSEKKILLVWLVIPICLFLFYSSGIYLHYFLILTPLPFFLFVALLSRIENKGKRWAFVANTLFIFVIIINLCQYVWSLQFVRG